MNDLQARLHTVDMVVKKQKNENEFLRHNLNKAVLNVIQIALSAGSMDIDTLSKVTGIHEKELNQFLESMVKDNKIKKEGELYSLVVSE